MPLTNSARDNAVGGVVTAVTYIGLANESGTELSGGSYARQAITYNAAAGTGIRDSDTDLTFSIPGTPTVPVTVARVLLRTAITAGTDKGYAPVGGTAPFVTTVDAATNAFTNYAHGLATGTRFFVFPINGGSVPTGLTSGTLYYTVGASTNTLQAALTAGGSAVDVTASGECWVQQCIPETYNSTGEYKIAAGLLDIYGLSI